MIQINNKKIQIDVDGEYTYRFYSTDSCSVSFSNPTGTTSNSIIETNIIFGSETCFTAAQNSLFLEVSTSTLCTTTQQLTVTSPCNWVNTITGITKTGEYEYLAAFPSPDPNSGSTGAYFYNWEYDTNIFTEVVTSDPRVLRLEVTGSIATGINYPVSVLINDSSTGCEVYQTYNETFCQPTVSDFTNTIVNSGESLFVLPQVTLCDSCSIDWSTLQISGNTSEFTITPSGTNPATNNLSYLVLLNISPTLTTGVYEFSYSVANEYGARSNLGTISIDYTQDFQSPSMPTFNDIVVEELCGSTTISMFTGDQIDTVIVNNNRVSYEILNNQVKLTYSSPESNTISSDMIEVQFGYLGNYSPIQTINVDLATITLLGISSSSVCTNNKHNVQVLVSYNLPVAKSLGIIMNSTATTNSGVNYSPTLVGTGTHTFNVQNIDCSSVVYNVFISPTQCDNSVKLIGEYTSPIGDPNVEIIFSSVASSNCTVGSEEVVVGFAGNYSNINSGFIEILLDTNVILTVGDSGCIGCSTQITNNESSSFNTNLVFDPTLYGANITITIRSSVDNTINSTVNLINPC